MSATPLTRLCISPNTYGSLLQEGISGWIQEIQCKQEADQPARGREEDWLVFMKDATLQSLARALLSQVKERKAKKETEDGR